MSKQTKGRERERERVRETKCIYIKINLEGNILLIWVCLFYFSFSFLFNFLLTIPRTIVFTSRDIMRFSLKASKVENKLQKDKLQDDRMKATRIFGQWKIRKWSLVGIYINTDERWTSSKLAQNSSLFHPPVVSRERKHFANFALVPLLTTSLYLVRL